MNESKRKRELRQLRELDWPRIDNGLSNPAVHEAGHIVVGLSFGCRFTEVSIEGDAGITIWSAPHGKSNNERLTIAVAGSVAEECFGSTCGRKPLVSWLMDNPDHRDWSIDGSDIKVAWGLAGYISQQKGSTAQEMLLDAEEEVREILHAQQNEILIIARGLDERKRLTEAEVIERLRLCGQPQVHPENGLSLGSFVRR